MTTTRNAQAKVDLLEGAYDEPVPDKKLPSMLEMAMTHQRQIDIETELRKSCHAMFRRALKAEYERDMLARRCAEQAKHIAGLLELQAEEAAEAERHPLADAIAVMQRQGVR